jgi:antitoxin CcdA
MRTPAYDPSAPKQTVSLTLNSDLYAKAKAMGLNASRVAEQALADAYRRECAERLKAELAAELSAVSEYESEFGSFAESVCREFGEPWDAEPAAESPVRER